MLTLHTLSFFIHIICGSAALLLFWAPALMKKGSLDHITFGRYYNQCMYLVSLTGAIMALLVLASPVLIHVDLLSKAENAQWLTQRYRIFSALLLYLSLLTAVSVRHATLVLRYKQNRQKLTQALHLAMMLSLAVGALPIFYLGYQFKQHLHLIFAILGLLIATGMLRYSIRKHIKAGEWVSEHLAAIIGSGIGAYTAFFAFGARQLFNQLGHQWQLIFWIGPGVVGAICIAYLSRKYSTQTELTLSDKS